MCVCVCVCVCGWVCGCVGVLVTMCACIYMCIYVQMHVLVKCVCDVSLTVFQGETSMNEPQHNRAHSYQASKK